MAKRKRPDGQQAGLPEGYTPIPPAVEQGQEGPAAQERRARLIHRGVIHAVGAFYHEVWRHQAERGEGKGFRGRKKRIGGPVERE